MWIFSYSNQYLYFCIAGGAFNPRKGTRPPFLPPSSIFMLDGGVL
nr:MAG TPA: hypothetical protein [Caudoviricetes sp.]